MSTNLNTLKAKVREVVTKCALMESDNLPPVLKSAKENNTVYYLLAEKMIAELASLMQRHEDWILRHRNRPEVPPDPAYTSSLFPP